MHVKLLTLDFPLQTRKSTYTRESGIVSRKNIEQLMNLKTSHLGLALFTTLALSTSCNRPVTPGAFNEMERLSDAAKTSSGGYPHSQEFKETAAHGDAFQRDRLQCAKCHGTDFSGGTAKVSCSQCHSTYPHPPAWASPAKHGEYFVNLLGKDDERARCTGCHSEEKERAGGAINCQTCHSSFPHPQGFRRRHGDAAMQYSGKCTVCHTDYVRHMGSKVGCMKCHDGDLRIGWVEPAPEPEPSAAPSTQPERDPAQRSKTTRKSTVKKLLKRWIEKPAKAE